MHSLKLTVLSVLGLLMLIVLASKPASQNGAHNPGTPNWRPLNLEEAKILAYLTPFGAIHRRAGLDVVVDTSDAGCYQTGFVGIELISTKTFTPGGMEDHEYFAVNLNTAEVYDPIPIPAQQLKSKVLFGVADILRKAHHIDGKVLQEYGSMQPELKGPPPCK